MGKIKFFNICESRRGSFGKWKVHQCLPHMQKGWSWDPQNPFQCRIFIGCDASLRGQNQGITTASWLTRWVMSLTTQHKSGQLNWLLLPGDRSLSRLFIYCIFLFWEFSILVSSYIYHIYLSLNLYLSDWHGSTVSSFKTLPSGLVFGIRV